MSLQSKVFPFSLKSFYSISLCHSSITLKSSIEAYDNLLEPTQTQYCNLVDKTCVDFSTAMHIFSARELRPQAVLDSEVVN